MATAPTISDPIATDGEVFLDGSMIEIISVQNGTPNLMLWDGVKEIVGPSVEHRGQIYEPAPIHSSVLQEFTLPTQCRPHGSTHEFLAHTCGLIANLAGIQEKSASLIARFVLSSALVEAAPVAPTLIIVGPDIARGNRLVSLLRCLCRHSVRLTGVTPAGFRSLANGPRFTYIIDQAIVSDKLWRLLDDASVRDRKVPFHGRLLDLYGAQVIHTNSVLAGDSWPLHSIQISMMPTGQILPVFDLDDERRVTEEFQSRLLSFRRTNLGAAFKLKFDTSQFTSALQNLAFSMAAATPDDIELQAEVFELLREEDEEVRAGRWIELSAVTLESLLVACHESAKIVYVSDLARIAQEISWRRGEQAIVDPGAIGKRLKLLGFATERDAKGKKLRLTERVRCRAEQLAYNFGIHGIENDRPVSSTQRESTTTTFGV
jgi:hypothetical protein